MSLQVKRHISGNNMQALWNVREKTLDWRTKSLKKSFQQSNKMYFPDDRAKYFPVASSLVPFHWTREHGRGRRCVCPETPETAAPLWRTSPPPSERPLRRSPRQSADTGTPKDQSCQTMSTIPPPNAWALVFPCSAAPSSGQGWAGWCAPSCPRGRWRCWWRSWF